MLSKLAGIHGKAFGREVLGPGLKDVKTGFVVTPNGLLMGQLRGVDTKLSEDDSIILRARSRRLQFSSDHDRKCAWECCDYLEKDPNLEGHGELKILPVLFGGIEDFISSRTGSFLRF